MDGSDVGALVGVEVGNKVGIWDGNDVGTDVGSKVGIYDGNAVGLSVGIAVGAPVHRPHNPGQLSPTRLQSSSL